MNPHLTPEQVSNWLLGDRPPDRARHLHDCADCSREVELMESALRDFRSAVADWDAPPPSIEVERPRVPLAARWAVTAAAAIALAMVPVYLHQRRAAADSARADAVLLEQVDAEVSQAVPRPMEPLVPLVSWSSSEKGNGETQ
jgi:hypothetical protein